MGVFIPSQVLINIFKIVSRIVLCPSHYQCTQLVDETVTGQLLFQMHHQAVSFL